MKIAFIAPRFHTNLYYRVISLQNQGHEVRVFSLYKGKSEYYKDIDLQILPLSLVSKFLIGSLHRFNKSYLKSHYEIILQYPGKKLEKKLKEFDPDLIFLKEFKNLLTIKTLFAAKTIKAKIIIFTQSQKSKIKGSKLFFTLLIKLFRWFNVKAFITPVRKTYIEFSLNALIPVFYIPFVYPIQVHKNRELPISEGKLKIISIGKYVKRKDHLTLLKAVNALVNEKIKIELNIFGEVADINYYDMLSSYIKENGLTEFIHLRTNVPYKDIQKEYLKHDLFILPSYNEPAAYSPVEAMAYGLPVICSSECGTNCYITEKENGFIFKAKDWENLKNKIKLIATDFSLLNELSQNAICYFKQYHDLPKFAEKIENVLNQI